MGGTIRPPAGETAPDPLPSLRSGAESLHAPISIGGPRSGADATSATLFGGGPPDPYAQDIAAPPSMRVSMVSLDDVPLVCPTCGVRYPVEFKVCPRDAAELVDARTSGPPDELLGQTIASTYAVTRVLGEGGMGRVYEARHLRIGGKRFAIKALHEEYARNKEVLARFQREAEAASSIESPNVVEVYDVLRTEDGRPFMVAELLVGKELGDYLLDVGRMTTEEALPVARQICAGLSAAHKKSIIHRDMKPENVFLVGDPKTFFVAGEIPRAKILDFGISKSGDAPGTQLTKTGVIMGTPSFMAPEQAKGEKVNHLADIYSMGAILYAMITGRRPFDKGEPTATLTALLLEDPPRPRSLDPKIPEALEAIIQKAMAKAPEDRYQSVDEMDRDLAALLEATTPSIPNAGRTSRTVSDAEISVVRARLMRTSPLAVLFGVLSLALLIAGVARQLHGARAPLSSAEIVLAFVLPAVLVGTGAAFALAYVRGIPVEESHRSELVSNLLSVASTVGLVTLGFGFLFVEFVETLVLHRAVGVAWPVWEWMLPLLALTGAAGAVLSAAREHAS